jgi:hypothetical protein
VAVDALLETYGMNVEIYGRSVDFCVATVPVDRAYGLHDVNR